MATTDYQIGFVGTLTATNPNSIQLLSTDNLAISGPSTGTITSTGTTGTFQLTFGGQTTSSLQFNDTALDVQAALQALTNIGTNVTVAAGPVVGTSTSYAISFSGSLATTPISSIGNIVTSGDVITSTAATFTLNFNGQTTAAMAFNATPAAVQTALQAERAERAERGQRVSQRFRR